MARRPDIGYFEGDKDLLNLSTWQKAILPIEVAESIDPLVYQSLTFSLLENEALWTRDWIFIGTSDDVANSGDLLPYTIGNHGIHVQRIKDGALCGRFNNAQHGGCRVVPLQCQQGSKTKCSFTSCGYSRDRDVIVAGENPEDGENSAALMYQYLGLRPERLLPVLVVEDNGLIFVNLDGVDQDFSGSMLQSELKKLDIFAGKIPRSDKKVTEISANWKLFANALLSKMTNEVSSSTNSISFRSNLEIDDEFERQIDVSVFYPNLVSLKIGEGYCWIGIQPTALQKTQLRVHYYHDAEGCMTEDLKLLEHVIAQISLRAEAKQIELTENKFNPESATASNSLSASEYWAQSVLINRLLTLPKTVAPDLMYQPLKNYLI